MIKNIIYGLIIVLIIAGFIGLLYYAMITGIEKAEKGECMKWIKESKVHPNYYLVDWQAAQCLHYGFDISGIDIIGD
ncbi:MAG TPA: hypothetical protein PLA99_02840 [Candidatus Paceibacterota bacterium]|nr:hypothetical protein [Candidatus Paceibacterota bacterium]